MHIRELAELAALIALHSGDIVQRQSPALGLACNDYWAASKCRLDRWGRVLRRLAAAAHEPHVSPLANWPRVRPVLEEILVAELLTRLWAATAAAHDAATDDQILEPVARNVLAGHLEARQRVLALIADGRAIAVAHGIQLNQVRRRLERWTDMLLAHVARLVPVEEFAFDPARAHDFAEELDGEAADRHRELTARLAVASLKCSLAGLDDRAPSADLNRRIAAAIAVALDPQSSHSIRVSTSIWLDRMSQMASDTEGMIDELMRLDSLQL